MENFEKNSNFEQKDLAEQYNSALQNFYKNQGLEASSGDVKIFSFSNQPKSNPRFSFIENPVSPESASKLDNNSFAVEFFSKAGFSIRKPLSVINQNSTPLFISAGVQALDDFIHKQTQIEGAPFFVAQPVIRTQYKDSISEGSSTSFINICTEATNIAPDDHFRFLAEWLRFFEQLGLEKKDFIFKEEVSDTKWGDVSFKSKKLKIYYQGLEIGVALFNHDLSNTNPPNNTFSDIGLGLERIKWILRGGSYFDTFLLEGLGPVVKDKALLSHLQTLCLLAGSGVKPSNREHGYRFRLFSKYFVSGNVVEKIKMDDYFSGVYDYWASWALLNCSKEEALRSVKLENERNFNRLLLDRLKEKYSDVDLDINQSTKKLIAALKGTNVNTAELLELLNELYVE